jgi:hypothetical protein
MYFSAIEPSIVAARVAGATLRAPSVELREQRRVDRVKRGPTGDRDQRLEPHRFAPRLDAALVVALARPAEARLHEIMRGQRREAIRERPLAADQDPADTTGRSSANAFS